MNKKQNPQTDISKEAGDSACKKLTAEDELKEEDRKQREKDCIEMATRYSLPTRMGQWVENTSMSEVKSEEYTKKQNKCATFYQKQTMVIDHLYFTEQIAKYDPFLKYDTPIQIQSNLQDISNKPPPLLSVLITESQIDTHNILSLNENCFVTVSYENLRIRRNVFTLISVNKKPNCSIVLYGEDFFIRILDSGGEDLFLTGLVPHVDNFGESKGRIPMGLTTTPNRYSMFRVIDTHREKMLSKNNSVVSTFESITVAQAMTNVLLGVNTSRQICTTFCVDHPAECYTYRDSFKRVTSENYWKFLTQTVEESTGDTQGAIDEGGNETTLPATQGPM